MNKAVFLDKDGTINEDLGYLTHPCQIKLLPGSADAIKLLNNAGFKVFVVSNQAGIARGIVTEDILQALDKRLQKEILKNGAFVDRMYYCPHHPEYGVYPYRAMCDCRKPNNGLLKKAAKEHNVDLGASYMIGDKISDIECGKASGAKTILVLTGKGRESNQSEEIRRMAPDFIAKDLFAAVKWLLNGGNGNGKK